MKKYLLSVIATFITFASFAQLEDAKWLIGGNIYGRYTHYSGNSNSNNATFGLAPSAGKVLSSSSVAGVYAGVSFGGYNSEATDSHSTGFNTGLYYQKYYPLSGSFYFNWKILAGFETSRTSYTTNGTTTKNPAQKNYSMQFNPGLAWKVSEKILVNGAFGVASFTIYDSDPSSVQALSIGFNAPTLGVNFILK
jgi:hypothetical protein